MHIAEGLLPPAHAAAWTLAAVPFVIHGSRGISRALRTSPGSGVALGAAAGFTLVLSSLKLPSVTGSSSHPTGVGLGVALCGPATLAPLTTIVLLFQALLLSHGGITTLGANVFAMGVAGPWTMWAVHALTVRMRPHSSAAIWLGTVAGVLATYATTAAQLGLAYAPLAGGFGSAFASFAAVFGVTQIPLALGEAALTVWAMRTLQANGLSSLVPAEVHG
jgi:cobalt/nickel transport system permease protein